MPKEIRDGYNRIKAASIIGFILDDTKTIVTKVNAAINQPWGVPMAVTAFDDIMYAEYFVNTKRTVLDSINNQIIYMTFPEGKEKGTSSLTKDQQREQHEKVKEAVITRRSQSGISFFSLASGTKIDKMDVDIDIFDEKNEASIKDAVPGALGISSASLDGNTKGNYATASLNLELVASNTYTWVENFMFELCPRPMILVVCTTQINLFIMFFWIFSLIFFNLIAVFFFIIEVRSTLSGFEFSQYLINDTFINKSKLVHYNDICSGRTGRIPCRYNFYNRTILPIYKSL